jgi:hypothetical protein
MDDFDNLVGKKSADPDTDNHDDPISEDENESHEDLGTSKNNCPENKRSLENSSGPKGNKKSKKDRPPDDIAILEKNILELFVDQIGNTYAAVKIKNHIEAIPIYSDRFRDWIIKTCYDYEKQVRNNDPENVHSISILSNEEAAKYQTIIRFEAEEQRKERRLETRVAGSVDSDPSANEDDNVIYYDLCNAHGEIIKVTRNGWQIIKHGDPSSGEDHTRIIIFKTFKQSIAATKAKQRISI